MVKKLINEEASKFQANLPDHILEVEIEIMKN
jgi:hypothetical protein